MLSVLLVEDDRGIAESLKLYLENSSMKVDVLFEGTCAVETILQGAYDMVILDINLPGKNGMDICKEVRQQSNVPIIMLTARTSEMDTITWLEVGADDYVAKPFSPGELVARMHSVLRRVQGNQEKKRVLEYEDVVLYVDRHQVYRWWELLPFTKTEFHILKKIMEADGNVVERKTLMKEVIGYENYFFDRTVDSHIKNIRHKLGKKDMIITIYGTWYRLNK